MFATAWNFDPPMRSLSQHMPHTRAVYAASVPRVGRRVPTVVGGRGFRRRSDDVAHEGEIRRALLSVVRGHHTHEETTIDHAREESAPTSGVPRRSSSSAAVVERAPPPPTKGGAAALIRRVAALKGARVERAANRDVQRRAEERALRLQKVSLAKEDDEEKHVWEASMERVARDLGRDRGAFEGFALGSWQRPIETQRARRGLLRAAAAAAAGLHVSHSASPPSTSTRVTPSPTKTHRQLRGPPHDLGVTSPALLRMEQPSPGPPTAVAVPYKERKGQNHPLKDEGVTSTPERSVSPSPSQKQSGECLGVAPYNGGRTSPLVEISASFTTSSTDSLSEVEREASRKNSLEQASPHYESSFASEESDTQQALGNPEKYESHGSHSNPSSSSSDSSTTSDEAKYSDDAFYGSGDGENSPASKARVDETIVPPQPSESTPPNAELPIGGQDSDEGKDVKKRSLDAVVSTKRDEVTHRAPFPNGEGIVAAAAALGAALRSAHGGAGEMAALPPPPDILGGQGNGAEGDGWPSAARPPSTAGGRRRGGSRGVEPISSRGSGGSSRGSTMVDAAKWFDGDQKDGEVGCTSFAALPATPIGGRRRVKGSEL